MILFEQMINALEAVQNNMPSIVASALQDPLVESQIESMNKEQMYAGKTSTGNDILPDYKQITRELKYQAGKPYDRVTLNDTGAFYAAIYVIYTSDGFFITSSDKKRDKLVNKYSEFILGLTDENLQQLREIALPYIINKVRSQIL